MRPSVVTNDSIVELSKHHVSCDMSGEAAILDLKSGEYFGLNAVGARIWNLIQEPKHVREVLNALLDEYDVGAEECERDLLALLNELAVKGLLKISSEEVG